MATPPTSYSSRARRHPARVARAGVLTASVVATGGIAGAMAYAEGTGNAAAEGLPVPAPFESVASLAEPAQAEPVVPDNDAQRTAPATVDSADAYGDGLWLGSEESTNWGVVQVQVVISAGEIVEVKPLQFPDDRQSATINNGAVVVLEADALAIQGADLDVVSGATYTSQAYAASLQAALDDAVLVNQTAPVPS